jgi:iron-sulfur cluster assembly protein
MNYDAINILYQNKGDKMVEVTASATKQIAEYFKDKEIEPIRIFLNEGCCGGPSLAMALDEKKNTDDVFEIDGFTYVVDKLFMEKAKPIKVDYLEYGFKVDCAIQFSSGCSSCGTAGSCCSS